jgi:hypothetical protein
MKHFLAILLITFFTSAIQSQASLNDYDMALIPAKFDFQKSDNQYRINATIKAFLKQKGFDAYLSSDVLPEGFIDYNCNKVFVNAIDESSLFSTKIKIEFKDCKSNILFTTDLSESRIKDFAPAYNQALLATLKTFDKAKYKFSGKTYYNEEAQEKLQSRNVESVSTEVTKVIKSENGVVYEKVEKAASELKRSAEEASIKVKNLINSEELVLYKTTRNAIFICNTNGKNGIVFAKNDVWFFEYLDNGKLVSEKLDIKF